MHEISLQEFLERVHAEQQRQGAFPTCTLVIGSGFSLPTFPSVKDILHRWIPIWMSHENPNPMRTSPSPRPVRILYRHELPTKEQEQESWKQIHESAQSLMNDRKDCKFSLGLDGFPLPQHMQNAYRAVFNPVCSLPFGSEAASREFLQALVTLSPGTFNEAHAYLGQLIRARFYQRLFCNTIITTNFDPLLTRALSWAGVDSYSSSEVNKAVKLTATESQTVHIVHAHGTPYRYCVHEPKVVRSQSQVNNFKNWFETNLVIVVGYGAWDDAITSAMKHVKTFQKNLYWCEHRPRDGLTPSQPVPAALSKLFAGRKKQDTFLVPITGASALMQDLYLTLAGGVSRQPSLPSSVSEAFDRIEWEPVPGIVPDACVTEGKIKSLLHLRDTPAGRCLLEKRWFQALGDEEAPVKELQVLAQEHQHIASGEPGENNALSDAQKLEQRWVRSISALEQLGKGVDRLCDYLCMP